MHTYYIIGFVIISIIVVILYYNKFISMRNKIEEAWSSIDFQLQRRYTMIETFQEVCGAKSKEEKLYYNEITEMKHVAIEAEDMKSQTDAENKINIGLQKLFLYANSNADLKSNSNFKDFQTKIYEIEDDAQRVIRYYNALVRDKNSMIEKFPNNIFAKLFNVYLSDFFNMQVSH